MKLQAQVQQQILMIANLLCDLSDADYAQPVQVLSNATIGEHLRHAIEMYYCLIEGYNGGIINYDKRERNQRLQQDLNFARERLLSLQHDINLPNKKLILKVAEPCGSKFIDVETNFDRELLYNLEHTVHHMALIKIGVLGLQKCYEVHEHFGVANSTIIYKQAQ